MCVADVRTHYNLLVHLFPLLPLPEFPLRVQLPLDKELSFIYKQLFPLNFCSDSTSLFSSFHSGSTELLFFVWNE